MLRRDDDYHLGYKIPIMVPTYGEEEIEEVMDSLRSRRVTLGRKVREFERDWAAYIGTKYAVMLNSGSSANLLAHSVFTNPAFDRRIRPGSEVITPAVTWATTVSPIVNIGAVPVFVDVELDTLNIDVNYLEDAVTEKTVAITFVHLLGNPCNMDRLMSFAKKHDFILIEDACNAHGATYRSRRCGSFGDVGTFSFYFSHIISTIEGGMITTDNYEIYQNACAMRSFGWTRDLASENAIAKEYPFIDKRFLFANLGYNFRPTELQGAFGIQQMKRLPRFLKIRRENAEYWLDELRRFERFFVLPKTTKWGRHVWHHFPVTIRPEAPFARTDIVRFLEKSGIEIRPISTGNITEQPVMKYMKARKVGSLANAKLIMRNSFEWGNHHGINEEKRAFVVKKIGEFIRNHT